VTVRTGAVDASVVVEFRRSSVAVLADQIGCRWRARLGSRAFRFDFVEKLAHAGPIVRAGVGELQPQIDADPR